MSVDDDTTPRRPGDRATFGGWSERRCAALRTAVILLAAQGVSQAAWQSIETPTADAQPTTATSSITPSGPRVIRGPLERSWEADQAITIQPAFIRPEDGALYMIELPPDWVHFASSSDAPVRSPAILFEDGRPLGPANASHAKIRTEGHGAFSHWDSALRFSTSDNSDPRTNGRRYELRSPAEFHEIEIQVIGAATYQLEIDRNPVINTSVTIENAGDTPLTSPWIVSNGRSDWFDVESILREIAATADGSTERNLAEATWRFLVENSYHHEPPTGLGDVHDPVRFLNVYGYGFCDDAARVFEGLTQAAGLKSRVWLLEGHVVPEVWYDEAWHMYDPDFERYFAGDDGQVLGVEQIAADPAPLQSAAHLATDSPSSYARAFDADALGRIFATTEDNLIIERQDGPTASMECQLGPGERLERRWFGEAGYIATRWKERPPSYGNGTWSMPSCRIRRGGSPWARLIELPYALLEVRIAVSNAAERDLDAIDVVVTVPGVGPIAVQRTALRHGEARAWTARLDNLEPAYSAHCTVHFAPGVGEAGPDVSIEASFQTAPDSLPALRSGRNEVEFRTSSTTAITTIRHRYVTIP